MGVEENIVVGTFEENLKRIEGSVSIGDSLLTCDCGITYSAKIARVTGNKCETCYRDHLRSIMPESTNASQIREPTKRDDYTQDRSFLGC